MKILSRRVRVLRSVIHECGSRLGYTTGLRQNNYKAAITSLIHGKDTFVTLSLLAIAV